jgi:acyl-CoA synthetase (AMP-forming)/AMP-acid ligase II
MHMTGTAEMTNWNFADIYESVAARAPERPCQIQGDRVITWGEFDRRANALAADFVSIGMTQGSKVACYLYNEPEYMETMTAAFKVAMAPVNTNYRYGPDEIVYLFDNADAEAVVFHACFADIAEQVRDRLTKVRRWYVVSDETGSGPAWATPYEHVVAAGADCPLAVTPRSASRPPTTWPIWWAASTLPCRGASCSVPARSCTAPASSRHSTRWPAAGQWSRSSTADSAWRNCSRPSSIVE